MGAGGVKCADVKRVPDQVPVQPSPAEQGSGDGSVATQALRQADSEYRPPRRNPLPRQEHPDPMPGQTHGREERHFVGVLPVQTSQQKSCRRRPLTSGLTACIPIPAARSNRTGSPARQCQARGVPAVPDKGLPGSGSRTPDTAERHPHKDQRNHSSLAVMPTIACRPAAGRMPRRRRAAQRGGGR